MAIGERIHFFRNLRGMTQKYLGLKVGFPERSADIRMAQYESGKRTPKADLTEKLAYYLGVSPKALDVPDIDTEIGLMHTLFVLEDRYGLKIGEIDGEVCIRLDRSMDRKWHKMHSLLLRWWKEAEKLEAGEITQEEYNEWRYTYPAVEAQRTHDALSALQQAEKDND